MAAADESPIPPFYVMPGPNDRPRAEEPRGLVWLPWALGGLMLVVYGLTLNHWVIPRTIQEVGSIQGLNYLPYVSGPVNWLVWQPFGWLPVAWVPAAMNLGTAVAAALTLVLLARSVMLLPHDLTPPDLPWWVYQPPRLMTRRWPWVPPVVAVLAGGCQLTFWENATNATSEMLDLLLFAGVIWCLLEFNARQRDGWLLGGAFLFGLAMANDWVMAAFLPAGVFTLVFLKRVFVFSPHFFIRLLLFPRTLRWRLLWLIPACWLAGLLLWWLTPLVICWTPSAHLGFGEAVKLAGHTYQAPLAHFPHLLLVIIGLFSVAPFYLICSRFYQFLAGCDRVHLHVPPEPGDTHIYYLAGQSQWPVFYCTLFFQLGYAFFWGLDLWSLFDSPISPTRLGLGIAALPLYYLGAMGTGYFTGHFLLTSEHRGPLPPAPNPGATPRAWRCWRQLWWQHRLKQLTLLVVVGGLLAYPFLLAGKNLRAVLGRSQGAAVAYYQTLAGQLPPAGAVVLSHNPGRLAYLESALIRAGRARHYLLLNFDLLATDPGYAAFLATKNPGFPLGMAVPADATPVQRAQAAFACLKAWARDQPVFCLPPAPVAEPLAEFFSFEPAGLLCRLRPLPDHGLPVATPPAASQRANAEFWGDFSTRTLPDLLAQIHPWQRPGGGLLREFLATLRLEPIPDAEALYIAPFYASALNDWGVTLQRGGEWRTAAACFDGAQQLDPECAAAQINLEYNALGQTGQAEPLHAPQRTMMSLGGYRDWQHVVRSGQVDDPNFCFMLGSVMSESRQYRSALAQVERTRELDPRRPEPCALLAHLFLNLGDGTNALRNAQRLLENAPGNRTAWFLQASASMAVKDYPGALAALGAVLAKNPADTQARLNRAIVYRLTQRPADARREYETILQTDTNALSAIFDLGDLADEAKQTNAAIQHYQEFMRRAPAQMPQVAVARKRLEAMNAPPPH